MRKFMDIQLIDSSNRNFAMKNAYEIHEMILNTEN
jgi:hypothetical protein